MTRRLLLPCAAVALIVALAPAPAPAATGPCLADVASPSCRVWSGTAVAVADGDTLDVRVGGRVRRVRIAGLDAMELRRYSRTPSRRRGQCHSRAATARLEALVRAGGGEVRLTARDPRSRSGRRLRRSIAVPLGGAWRDVGRILVAEGHALWLPNRREWGPNAEYSALAERARAAGVGLWDPDACGAGPAQTAAGLALWVNADADGTDARNVNGEWVKIENLDSQVTVPLGGWWLRDSFQRRFRFPAGARIAPGATVTVHVGRGRSRNGRWFWGLRAPVFENPVGGRRVMGDGAYLFDPHGDLRAAMQYPCRVLCPNPAAGAVVLRADARGAESVTLRNVGAQPIDLEAHRLESFPYVYTFRPDTLLAPGGTLRVRIGGSRRGDRAGLRPWGTRRHILDDRGDVVRLATFGGAVAACVAWGSRRC